MAARIRRIRCKIQTRRAAADESAAAPILTTAWEQGAAGRLGQVLSHVELEAFLGELVYSIRRPRMRATAVDRRGTKAEPAAALLT